MNEQHSAGTTETMDGISAPWHCRRTHPDYPACAVRYITAKDGLEIATLYNTTGNERRGERAATLIAAAPELLAALKACADSLAILAAHNQPPAIDHPSLCEALAAIAKAEGRS